jgi:hypothetical protein
MLARKKKKELIGRVGSIDLLLKAHKEPGQGLGANALTRLHSTRHTHSFTFQFTLFKL